MNVKQLRKELIKQLVTLATAGFGLVAALAWNEAIQAFVKEYIDQYISRGSGILSRFVYAVLITAFAVFVTYQLTKLIKDDEKKD
ncbi:hypothetical protein HYU92_01200 [Candidatus Curtissbacteria bacterium]|nr:hypothetical protein [Candidatus Curtissbacteria bacterium]